MKVDVISGCPDVLKSVLIQTMQSGSWVVKDSQTSIFLSWMVPE